MMQYVNRVFSALKIGRIIENCTIIVHKLDKKEWNEAGKKILSN